MPAVVVLQHVDSKASKEATARFQVQLLDSLCRRAAVPAGPGRPVRAASELVELDGEGHLQVGHDAHADEDAQHDDGVHGHAQPVLDVGRD